MKISAAPIAPRNRDQVVQIVHKQSNFLPCEMTIAEEVIDGSFKPADDYRTLVALDDHDRVLGFISYGAVPLTDNRFDLYWIAVDPDVGRLGVGTILLHEMENILRREGSGHIYIDTSSTNGYLAARRFYEKNDFHVVAQLENFYRQGDDKIIYRKIY